VRAIPDNVLIGSDGTVLARHMEVTRLRELLAELFPA
jgi:hypothetical protein